MLILPALVSPGYASHACTEETFGGGTPPSRYRMGEDNYCGEYGVNTKSDLYYPACRQA